ncbi:DUF2971 domain-containing protein [Vibrio kyushuensis]|uniref:DUF2971 domain-containing protein n=1 Tax=Vibrio kyushuensis TaxID=2910249 RepID=UPI003D14BD62
MKLYKYLPVERIDVLENLKIRFTQLSSLNDPYEMLHSFDVSSIIEPSFNDGIQKLNTWWATLSVDEQQKGKPNYDKTLEELHSHRERLISKSLMTKELSELCDKLLGILSLSQTKKNPLMWSHYADSGSGFVIEFDSEHEFFHKKDPYGLVTDPIVVEYEQALPVFDASLAHSRSKLVGVKSKEWKYEQEVRLTLNLIGIKPVVNQRNRPVYDDFGNKIYLIDIPKDAIKTIYLGPRVKPESKLKILNALNENTIDCDVYEHDVSLEKVNIIPNSEYLTNC